MALIQTLQIGMVLLSDKFTQGLNKTRKEMTAFESTLGKVQGVAATLLPALSFAGVVAGVKQAADRVDFLAKTATRLNVAIKEVQAFQLFAEEGGVEFNEFANVLQKFQLRIAELKAGVGEALPAFKALGISAEDVAGKSVTDNFTLFLDRINLIGDNAEKTRISMKLFEETGGKLISTFANGGQGLRDVAKYIEDSGMAIDNLGGKKVEAAVDAVGRLTKSFEALFNALAVKLAPALTDFANKAAKTVNQKGLGDIESTSASPLAFAFGSGSIFDIFTKVNPLEAISGLATGQLGGLLDARRGAAASEEAYNRMLAEREVLLKKLAADDASAKAAQAAAADEARQKSEALANTIQDLFDSAVNESNMTNLKQYQEEMKRREEEWAETMRDAADLFESTKTPFERSLDQWQRATDLFKMGLIDEETLARVGDQIDESVGRSIDSDAIQEKLSGALEAGSREARSAVLAYQMRSNTPESRTAAAVERQEQVVRDQLAELREIRVALRAGVDI